MFILNCFESHQRDWRDVEVLDALMSERPIGPFQNVEEAKVKALAIALDELARTNEEREDDERVELEENEYGYEFCDGDSTYVYRVTELVHPRDA